MSGSQENGVGHPTVSQQLEALIGQAWLVALIAVLLVAVTVGYLQTKSPLYRASATLQIDMHQKQLEIANVYSTGIGTLGYFGTQVVILGSRDLAARAVERIDWRQSPEFVQPLLGRELPTETDAETLQAQLTDRFVAALKVEPLPATQVVRIHFNSESAAFSALAANTLAQTYIESALDDQQRETERATQWLASRLQAQRARLKQAEQDLSRFRQSTPALAYSGQRAELEAALMETLERQRSVRFQLAQLAPALSAIDAAADDDALQRVPALLADDLVQAARQRYRSSGSDAAGAAYHRALLNAAALLREEQRALKDVDTQLDAQVAASRQALTELESHEVELKLLEQAVEAQQTLYQTLSQRFYQVQAAGDYPIYKATLLDPAVEPVFAFSPRKKRAVLVAGMLGLLLGSAFVLLRQQWRQRSGANS